MMNQGPEAGLFSFSYFLFIFVRDFGPLPPKIVGQIRGVFSFEGTLAWVTSPSWPPPKPTAGSASVSGRRRGPVGAPLEDADLGTKDPGAGPHTEKSRRQGLCH